MSKDEAKHDKAVEDSFPASDPPANSGITGPRIQRPKPDDARPTGTPTDERHAAETAYHGEPDVKPKRG